MAVKCVPGGRVSAWVTSGLREGDTVEVSVPGGRFTTEPNPLNARHLLGVAAGSGITPIASIIKSVLLLEPHSRCTLVYGNRDPQSVILRKDLDQLTAGYGERLRVIHVYSRSGEGDTEPHGRLTHGLFRELAERHDLNDIDEAYLCGPAQMLTDVRTALTGLGLDTARIHSERFTGAAAAPAPPSASTAGGAQDVTIIDQGARTTVPVRDSETVLDAGLRAGLDLPYSCKEGICGTCRAKTLCGDVRLDDCELQPEEVEAGYVLTCRTRPAGPGVAIDFDQP